jgi:hypothetical protein
MIELQKVICPRCEHKTKVWIRPDTLMLNFPLYCSYCRTETLINIKDLHIHVIEPDAKTQSLTT